MSLTILKEREKRSTYINDVFTKNPGISVISIKANIPGSNKQIPMAYTLINLFLKEVTHLVKVINTTFFDTVDGPYYILTLNDQNVEIKKKVIDLENNHMLGRFIDIDYFINPKKSLSRKDLNINHRRCFICNDYAYVCARNQRHRTSIILDYMKKSVSTFLSIFLAGMTTYAMEKELLIENKFGLVSKESNGSHDDMDYNLMVNARKPLVNYFQKMFLSGYFAPSLDGLLQSLRYVGVMAENNMLKATKGINCYRGFIFIQGVLLLSVGYTLNNSGKFEDIFENIKIIAKDIYQDFENSNNTFGQKMYDEHNITGVRGVIKEGLDIILNTNKINGSQYSNDDFLKILFYYMQTIDDTVFIKRAGSYENYLNIKNKMKDIDPNNMDELLKFNQFALDNNLTFGGSADLLISTIFLNEIYYLFI